MKLIRFFFFLSLLTLLLAPSLAAQSDGSTDGLLDGWDDIDSLFAEAPEEESFPEEELSEENTEAVTLMSSIRPRGFTLSFSGSANAGLNLNWASQPWAWNSLSALKPGYSAGVGLSGSMGLDLQLSQDLRLKTALSVSYPQFSLANAISEFYMDYNLGSTAFFRAGLFGANWGQALNFPAGNLIARVSEDWSGNPYMFRATVPIGVGGLEAVALLRGGSTAPRLRELGWGLKYNFALQNADIDLGAFYHDKMPLRAYSSLKTTLFGSYETYFEVMGAIDQHYWKSFSFTVDAGVSNTYFDDRLALNAEVFYNGEKNGFFWGSDEIENILKGSSQSSALPFYSGWNTALNIAWKAGGKHDIRLGLSWKHDFSSMSGQIIPAISGNLISGIGFAASATCILGPNGSGYGTAASKFSLYAGITVSGSYSYAHYE